MLSPLAIAIIKSESLGHLVWEERNFKRSGTFFRSVLSQIHLDISELFLAMVSIEEIKSIEGLEFPNQSIRIKYFCDAVHN